jgi:iron complex transport system substrate-binding protein
MTTKYRRVLHFWVSIPAGVLFVLWIASGTAMVYDSVRGGLHAFPRIAAQGDLRTVTMTPAALTKEVPGAISRLVLLRIGDDIYGQATTEAGTILLDASTGATLSPIDEETARRLLAGYEGIPPARVEKVVDRGYEYKYGQLPAWRGEFDNGRIIHISAASGEVQSWTDRQGMYIRAAYYWFHAFQLTDSPGLNAAIALLAIAWAIASVMSGFMLYRRGRRQAATAAALVSCVLFAVPRVEAAPRKPLRIVTLAPSCAEIADALGLGDRIVGVTDYTDWPPAVAEVRRVGSYIRFDVEAVAALRPDLVLATDDGNPPAALRQLRRLGIPVRTLRLRTYEQVEQSVLDLGTELGRVAEARTTVDEMRRVVACVAARTRDVPRPRVLFAYEMAPAVSAGEGTFTDQLITMAGGASVTSDSRTPYPRLTIESIVTASPEVIIVSSMNPELDSGRWTAWLGQWPSIPAVRAGRLETIDSTNVDRPSPRMVLGLVLLARTIHPGLFGPGDCLPALP